MQSENLRQLNGETSGSGSRFSLVQELKEIGAVAALREARCGLAHGGCVDPALQKGDFLEAGDALALSLLDRLDILRRLQQRRRRARVEPGEAAPQTFDIQRAGFEIEPLRSVISSSPRARASAPRHIQARARS